MTFAYDKSNSTKQGASRDCISRFTVLIFNDDVSIVVVLYFIFILESSERCVCVLFIPCIELFYLRQASRSLSGIRYNLTYLKKGLSLSLSLSTFIIAHREIFATTFH